MCQTNSHAHTHTNVHVYACCIYKHEQKNVTSGRASERSSEFSVFSVFVLLLQHCHTHSSTYTCTCERKYVCMYHARVFMLYNSSSAPPPATFLIGLINSDPAAGAAVNSNSMWEMCMKLLYCTCGRQSDWPMLTEAMHQLLCTNAQHVC